MFSNYLLQVNHFLLAGSSLVIAFFYYIAIPTVIRSRLTTDTSAMSSLVNSEVILLELINNNQALVKLNGKKLVVETSKNNSYILKNEYELLEEDGKLII
jgi:phosphate starvation-inducible membrane PsiE